MEEMSGGNNKVLCLAGKKMRLTTKSAHTKVKQVHCCSEETIYTLQWAVI